MAPNMRPTIRLATIRITVRWPIWRCTVWESTSRKSMRSPLAYRARLVVSSPPAETVRADNGAITSAAVGRIPHWLRFSEVEIARHGWQSTVGTLSASVDLGLGEGRIPSADSFGIRNRVRIGVGDRRRTRIHDDHRRRSAHRRRRPRTLRGPSRTSGVRCDSFQAQSGIRSRTVQRPLRTYCRERKVGAERRHCARCDGGPQPRMPRNIPSQPTTSSRCISSPAVMHFVSARRGPVPM